MNKFAIIAAATLTVATFGAAAIAQDATSDFEKADANKDLIVSMAEAMGVYPTLNQVLFDQADANKDGNLDESEFAGLQGLTAGLPGGSDSQQSSQDSSSQDSSSQDSSQMSSAPSSAQ